MERKITVYTKHGCGPCLITKKYLTEHGIPFKEINVSEQPTGLEDYWMGLEMDRLEGLK